MNDSILTNSLTSNNNSNTSATTNDSNNSSKVDATTCIILNESFPAHKNAAFNSNIIKFPMTPLRRRTRSQTIFYGDEINTLSEYNKQLIEDLCLLKKQINEKDNVIRNLNDIRDKLESEIQDLSASLFEEAYIIANSAKAETSQAEKLLKEANGKIDVLQAEVKALKELVMTSTPSTPNKHLHPQLNQKLNGHCRQSSLNQQQLSNLTIQPNLTSSPASSLILTSQHNNTLVTSTSLHGSNSNFNEINSNNSLSTEKTKHKRVPSYNDIQIHSKSFIDKIFQTNPISNNNTHSSLSTSSSSLSNNKKNELSSSHFSNNNQSASVCNEIVEVF
jgi:cell division protein FtsB